MKLELTKSKVGIIGCTSSKSLAPYGDNDWEFWGVNNLFLTKMTYQAKAGGEPKPVEWHKWFEIHPLEKEGDQWLRRWGKNFRGQNLNDYIADLKKLPCPVIMQKQWEEIPNSVAYPLAEILSKFGNYFTNTISYEIALAILLGAKEIGIWGVDMAVDTEYHHQRPSCEYFVGLARGMGIKVHIPAEADLCKTLFLYGFQEKDKHDWYKKQKSIMKSLDNQINDAQNQLNIFNQKLNQSIGARQAILESMKIWA